MGFVENLDKGIEKGLKGLNKGIPGGLPRFDKKIFNIQPGKQVSIVGAPKSGKTYFMLWRYVFRPWIAGERNIKWILYSLEVDAQQVAARLAGMFISHYYKRKINPNKLLGFGEDQLSDVEQEIYQKVREEHLIPLQEQLKIIEDKNDSNPTAIYKAALTYASKHGTFEEEEYSTTDEKNQPIKKKRRVGYTPNDPDEKIFIMIDTLGLMKRERNFSKKENMDKWLDEYAIELRNLLRYTIINCHHLNRNLSAPERKKLSGEDLQPELEDIKDTSAIGESSDMVIGIFNPNVHTEIKVHQGYSVSKFNGYYRSIHVMASRYTPSPINSALLFDFETGAWQELPLPTDTMALEGYYRMLNT